jgi:two-component system, OmpR family, response regulator ChvI
MLLHCLVRRPGAVKTREQLMDDAYPDRVSVSDRTIDSHVKRIRRKFAVVDPAFAGIEGVYGAGYRYNERPA